MENRGADNRTASRKGLTTGRHFVQDHPEREEVRSRVDLFVAELLRRHVGQRAHRTAGFRQERSRLELRRPPELKTWVGLDQTEVENLGSARREQNIRRLDITVDDASRMSRLKGVGESR